jgi:hypothetical protein
MGDVDTEIIALLDALNGPATGLLYVPPWAEHREEYLRQQIDHFRQMYVAAFNAGESISHLGHVRYQLTFIERHMREEGYDFEPFELPKKPPTPAKSKPAPVPETPEQVREREARAARRRAASKRARQSTGLRSESEGGHASQPRLIGA